MSRRPTTVPSNSGNSAGIGTGQTTSNSVPSGLGICTNSLQIGNKISTYPKGVNVSKVSNGRLFKSLDQYQFLYSSNRTVELTKLLRIKSCSKNVSKSLDNGLKTKTGDMEKKIEFDNLFDRSKEATSKPTVNLSQRMEIPDSAETSRSMSGRKYVRFSSARPPSHDTASRRSERSKSETQLYSNLHCGSSFVVKRVSWCQRQSPAVESTKVNHELFYPEKSVSHLTVNPDGNSGDQDEDAITWVLRENNPELSGDKNMKDITDGKDDNDSDDEIEYTFEKPVIHITHKARKVERKSVEFGEPNAEDMSIKSISDTDSDTQLQSHKQVTQQMERSPRQTMKLRTILLSNVNTGRDLHSNTVTAEDNNSFMVKGISPKKVEYKFEETLKTYLTSTGAIQQVATHNKPLITEKISPLVSTTKPKMATYVKSANKRASTLVPSTEKEDFTVRPTSLVPSGNYATLHQLTGPKTELAEDEVNLKHYLDSTRSSNILEEDRQKALTSKLYKVAKHQRSKQIISCRTPPTTPENTSPAQKSLVPKVLNGDNFNDGSSSWIPIKSTEVSEELKADNFTSDWKTEQYGENSTLKTKSHGKKKQKRSSRFKGTVHNEGEDGLESRSVICYSNLHNNILVFYFTSLPTEA